jgi:hypothetical protein
MEYAFCDSGVFTYRLQFLTSSISREWSMAHVSMRTRRYLTTAVLMLCAHATVRADVAKNAAWVDCNPGQDRLTVRYGAAPANDPTAIVFWSLVRFSKRPDGDADHVTQLLDVERHCRLSGGTVAVSLRPLPMNSNLNGLCGGIVRGEITIAFDRRTLLAPTALETGHCADPSESITELTVSGKDGAITIERTAR